MHVSTAAVASPSQRGEVAEYQSGAPLASDPLSEAFFLPTPSLSVRLRLVVSEGVYKIRDLLTMFAPTRVYTRPLAYVYLVTHKRAVPRRGGPFRRRRPSAPERSSGDILFPGIFTSRYITHRPGPRRGWRYAPRGLDRKGSGRAIPPLSISLSLFSALPFSVCLSFLADVCARRACYLERDTLQYAGFPFFLFSLSSASAYLISRRECKSPRTIAIAARADSRCCC